MKAEILEIEGEMTSSVITVVEVVTWRETVKSDLATPIM